MKVLRPLLSAALCFALAIPLAMTIGCGGSSGGGGTSVPTVAAPTNLTYTSLSATYVKGRAITINTPSSGGGTVTSYSVAPDLPAGLSLNTGTGSISGTPTAVAAMASYVVTAINAGGSATAILSIAVNDVLAIVPTTVTAAPKGSATLTTSGGSGTGYAWSITTNNSGGSIGAGTGVYTAGSTGSVTDTVQVTDSLGDVATRTVTITAGVSVSPVTVSLAPRTAQTLTASGGSGTGYIWSITTNNSGGSIGAGTGVYTAGATGGVTDTIQVADSLGNVATRFVTVTVGVGISGTASIAPKASRILTATGGSGTGYVWSITTNNSGGSIGAATGIYTAGSTGGVTDTVQVTDSLSNSSAATITVTAGTSISPATVSLAPKASQTLTASGGSGTGYAWSITTNNSGGSIGAGTGVYTAGPTG